MAYIYRLILGLLLFCVASITHAALEPQIYYKFIWRDVGASEKFTTQEALCNSSFNPPDPSFFGGAPIVGKSMQGSFCNAAIFPEGWINWNWAQWQTTTFQACPPDSELVGGVCTCRSGYKEQQGACVLSGSSGGGSGNNEQCKGLQSWCTGKQGFSTQFKGKGESADFFCHAAENFFAGAGSGSSWEPAFPGCSQGCMIISGGTTVSAKDDSGQWWTQGSGKYVGSTCDPNVINKLNEGKHDEKEVTPPDSKQPGKCNGQQGTVNGVDVCLPYSEVKGDGNTKTETNSDGSKKETKTETKCSGEKCTTTTTTTTKDSGGTTTNTNVTVTNTTKDDYCARNPGSSVCKALDPSKSDGKGDDDDGDKSSFGGSCSGGWSCEGDAIQCAVAREQHKRSCQLFEDRDNDAYRLYDAEKNKEGSVLGGLKGNKDVDISQYVNDRDDFIGSGACPADRVIFFSYGEVTIPYSRVCPYAEMLGTVLIICAGIAGARIITRRD